MVKPINHTKHRLIIKRKGYTNPFLIPIVFLYQTSIAIGTIFIRPKKLFYEKIKNRGEQ